MPKISVLMTVYNTKEEYLREAIESILNQTYSDFEFIIVDDGSTNNAPKILREYSEKDNRIKIIQGKHKGPAAASNKGWAITSGEYIARMDSDDISLPERFAKQVFFLDNNREYSAVGNNYEIFPKCTIISLLEKPKIMDFLKSCCTIHGSIMMRKKDFTDNNLSYNESLNCAIDYDLWCRAAIKLKFYNIQEVLYRYRVVGQGVTTLKREERKRNTIRIQKTLINQIATTQEEREKLINDLYCKTSITKTFIEKIFSIKNILKFDKKYKVITIFGFEIWICRGKYSV